MKILVSACLLGENCKYSGGNNYNQAVCDFARGHQVVPVCPSSQTCSACGHVWQGTRDLRVREWTCPECGVTHDRDVNAAVNILAEAKRIMNRKEQAKDA